MCDSYVPYARSLSEVADCRPVATCHLPQLATCSTDTDTDTDHATKRSYALPRRRLHAPKPRIILVDRALLPNRRVSILDKSGVRGRPPSHHLLRVIRDVSVVAVRIRRIVWRRRDGRRIPERGGRGGAGRGTDVYARLLARAAHGARGTFGRRGEMSVLILHNNIIQSVAV